LQLHQSTYFAGGSSGLGRNGSFAGVNYKLTEQNCFELRLKKRFCKRYFFDKRFSTLETLTPTNVFVTINSKVCQTSYGLSNQNLANKIVNFLQSS